MLVFSVTACNRCIVASRALQEALMKSRGGEWSHVELATATHDLELAYADFLAQVLDENKRAAVLGGLAYSRSRAIRIR
jgi:hypothetical protein